MQALVCVSASPSPSLSCLCVLPPSPAVMQRVAVRVRQQEGSAAPSRCSTRPPARSRYASRRYTVLQVAAGVHGAGRGGRGRGRNLAVAGVGVARRPRLLPGPVARPRRAASAPASSPSTAPRTGSPRTPAKTEVWVLGRHGWSRQYGRRCGSGSPARTEYVACSA